MKLMMKTSFSLLSAVLLAACSTAAIESNPVPQVPSEPTPTAAISLAEILGEWDVLSFDGYEPLGKGGFRPAIADFTTQGVQLRLECNTADVFGIIQDGRFVGRGGRHTEMGCSEEREERERRYFSFFANSPAIERLAGGRLRLAARESVLILERREQRRLAFVPARSELEGKWRMEDLTRYSPGGGRSGTGLSDVPGRIVFEGNRLSYDRCPQYGLTFSYSSDGRLTKTDGPSLPAEPDCAALDRPHRDAPGLPSAMEILPLLHSNPWVEQVIDGRVLNANERAGLLLTRVE